MSADASATRPAPRLGALLVAFGIVVLIAVLPQRYRLVPNWFAFSVMSLLIILLILAPLNGRNVLLRRIERVAELVAVGGLLLFNSANLVIVAYNVVEKPGALEPVPLFYTSLGIWIGNILIFTLIYWLVDADGPDARLEREARYPDFDFPAMDDAAHVPPNWRPGTIDYLFLAFTTSTAFSPTEAMPLTLRAKLLVILQSSISLATIAIVVARTINTLK